jgi:hypothetical protein
MRMHTFVSQTEVPADKMFDQLCRRLVFLRDKLISDLREANKIFVYKITARNLRNEEIARIRNAMRRYGKNTLLYVRYTDAVHLNGAVEAIEPGLMIGYIDRFGRENLGAETMSWERICKNAYKIWVKHRSDGADTTRFEKPMYER